MQRETARDRDDAIRVDYSVCRSLIRKRTEARQIRYQLRRESTGNSRARSLAREDERAYRLLGPVTYHYMYETLAALVSFYSLSAAHNAQFYVQK